MDKTQQVVVYLKGKFKADIIILEGSRASEKFREDSDWDIYLFVSDKTGTSMGWHLFDNELLDLHFVQLPVESNYVIKGAYGPRPFIKVLLDNKNKLGETIVENTKKARQERPKKLARKNYLIRKTGLEKNIDKIRAHVGSPAVCFYDISNFYGRAVRFWFDLRREWPLHPKEALPYIKVTDPDYYALLSELVTTSNWQKKPVLAHKIYARLFKV